MKKARFLTIAAVILASGLFVLTGCPQPTIDGGGDDGGTVETYKGDTVEAYNADNYYVYIE